MPELTDPRSVWADAIYVERHRRRLKQDDVAKLAGLDQTTVSKAELATARDETYEAIATALDIELPEAEAVGE